MVCSAVSAFPLAIHYLLLQTLACSLLLWMHTRNWGAASSITGEGKHSFVVLCSPGFCSMLVGCPGSVLLQLGQESGREKCLEGVGVGCGSPLPGLAGSMVCVLPALHWREERDCLVWAQGTPPFLPEIWRGWGSWLSLPAEVTGIGSNQWENPGSLSYAMLWYLTRSSSLDNVIPYLGDGEQLT